jgi:hypothetical protein
MKYVYPILIFALLWPLSIGAQSLPFPGGVNSHNGGGGSFPTTSVLDTCSRANAGPPPSASWTDDVTGIAVVSNKCQGVTSGASDNVASWNTVYGPNMQAYATLAALNGSNSYWAKVIVRGDFSSGNSYQVAVRNWTSANLTIERSDGGTPTVLATFDIAQPVVGDSFGAAISGSVITAWYKTAAGSWTSIGTTTDSTYSGTGKIGLDLMNSEWAITGFGGGSQ